MELAFLAASVLNGVDPHLLKAICFVESSHRPYVVALNDGGSHSYGICQIKLETAKFLGFKGTSQELMQPEENMYWAAAYLRYQKIRYKGNKTKAVSAYNCGSACNNKSYVKKVLAKYNKYRAF